MGVKRGMRYEGRETSLRAKIFGILVVGILLCGCGARPETIARIALLAPFEGRYREVGYNAYYAARLAVQDFGNPNIELLAIDDGGSVESAVNRAQALSGDPLVKAAIVLGYSASDQQTQAAFGDLPVLVVGYWNTQPVGEHIFMLTNETLPSMFTTPPTLQDITQASNLDTPVTGGEVFALEQYHLLSSNPELVTIVSSGNLPDEVFHERYINSALFIPEPGLMATLTYDAFSMALQAAQTGNPLTTLGSMQYEGLNGVIQFQDGYWSDAPIHYFRYDSNGELMAVEGATQ